MDPDQIARIGNGGNFARKELVDGEIGLPGFGSVHVSRGQAMKNGPKRSVGNVVIVGGVELFGDTERFELRRHTECCRFGWVDFLVDAGVADPARGTLAQYGA